MITKKALISATKQVAERAPYSRNTTMSLVNERHPRGLIGRALHQAGLSPQQIRAIQEDPNSSEKLLNASAMQWMTAVQTVANSGRTWGEIVAMPEKLLTAGANTTSKRAATNRKPVRSNI